MPKTPSSPEPETRYRIVRGVSVRVRPDPACPDFVDFSEGDTHPASAFPPHTDLAGLLASHAVEEVR